MATAKKKKAKEVPAEETATQAPAEEQLTETGDSIHARRAADGGLIV